MNVKVCYGCPLRHAGANNTWDRSRKSRCPILQSKLDGVRGLGLQSIDFKCPTKAALFLPGQQVAFQGRERDYDYGDDDLSDFTGWVMGWKGNKVRVVCEKTDKPICHILPSRLTLTGEDTRRVCVHCGMPEGVTVQIKSQGDDKPRPWRCRENYNQSATANPFDFDSDDYETVVLPCEFETPGSEVRA